MDKIEQCTENIPIMEYENPYKIEKRINRSSLQFVGDTFYTLYTEAKFNKFQKWLWKKLLSIKIEDVEETNG